MLAVTGCSELEPSKMCAGEKTINTIKSILPGDGGVIVVKPPGSDIDLSPPTNRLRRSLYFTQPTVESVDRDAGKVTCSALVRTNGLPDNVSEALQDRGGGGYDKEGYYAPLSYTVLTDASDGGVIVRIEDSDKIAKAMSYMVWSLLPPEEAAGEDPAR